MTAPEPTWECPRCGCVGCEGGTACPGRSTAPEPASDTLEGLGSYIQGLRDWAQMDCVPSAVGDVIRDCATTIEALSRQSGEISEAMVEAGARKLAEIENGDGSDEPWECWQAQAKGCFAAMVAVGEASDLTKLITDCNRLANSEVVAHCEGCDAWLLPDDDYVSDPGGVTGCWSAMTDVPSNRERPCYAYRAGKRDGRAMQEARDD